MEPQNDKFKNEIGLLAGFFIFILFLRVKPYIKEEEVNRGFTEALGLGLMRAAWWGIIGALLHLLITKYLLHGVAH